MYYRICPHCDAHLDPGERCDCQDKKIEAAPLQRERPQAKTPIAILPVQRPEVKHPGRYRYG